MSAMRTIGRLFPLMALVLVVGACASVAPVMQQDTDAPASEAPRSARETRHDDADPACPSQDFVTFLQRFADADSDATRIRYTRDPLTYEVPSYLVMEEAPGNPPMHVSTHHGRERLQYFGHRYIASADDFDQVDPDGTLRMEAIRAGAPKFPVSIDMLEGDGRKVVFGMEYEIDIYLFDRDDGCWYLSHVINPRD